MTARTIEQLKSEYEKLNKKKIEAETELKGAEKQLKDLQKDAEKEFGTSDVDELTKKLKEMEAKNEKQRSEYQELLDKIAGELAEVEKATSEAASSE
jgi:predicted  nucleic acid-binding Zn-ribbon protein